MFVNWGVQARQLMPHSDQRFSLYSPALRQSERTQWWSAELFSIIVQVINLFLLQLAAPEDFVTINQTRALGFEAWNDA